MKTAIVLSIYAICMSLVALGFCVAFCVKEWRGNRRSDG